MKIECERSGDTMEISGDLNDLRDLDFETRRARIFQRKCERNRRSSCPTSCLVNIFLTENEARLYSGE